jgi:hypothetical protein
VHETEPVEPAAHDHVRKQRRAGPAPARIVRVPLVMPRRCDPLPRGVVVAKRPRGPSARHRFAPKAHVHARRLRRMLLLLLLREVADGKQ